MTTSTQQLVDKVIAAHGGANAAPFTTVKIHTNIGGVVWPIKGHDGALADVAFTGSLTEQKSSWKNLFQPGYTSTFEPGKVELFDENGKLLEALTNPLHSFEGHTVETPWTRAQLVYFSSYATWNYATAPFNFLVPGVEINELEPWNEKGETLSRLEVIYPEGFTTHSKRQVFYFNEAGLLKRHDYWPVVLGGSSATQIIEGYKEFQGVKTGTKRNIYILNDADNSYQTNPVLVSIDILDVRFE
ncbi:hypothetical protein GN157_13085 [Flavobacterium rakeshii]|uniref:Uncharacterized protein n=1 Tax=Flavobacterium rakeshii TaxID=1038845 RepID=A0A6N8HFZ0_9FLAO|nr:hypothetical protein [Flavobacterium rakeshii]MUV04644.1 hypothetical protein [Flavobacterium rakeshii]